MKRERPAPVLVLALLTILVGVLSLAAGGGLALFWLLPPSPYPVGNYDLLDYLGSEMVGYWLYETSRPIVLMILGAIFLVAGFGLLEVGRWARQAALAAAGATLLLHALFLLYEVSYAVPSLASWRAQRFMIGMGIIDTLSREAKQSELLVPIGLMTLTIIFIIHALIALVVLFSPVVVTAFAHAVCQQERRPAAG